MRINSGRASSFPDRTGADQKRSRQTTITPSEIADYIFQVDQGAVEDRVHHLSETEEEV
jgi:hypothetical protein